MAAVDRVRPVLEADAEANDANETVEWPSVVAMYREGLLSLKVPRELGGPEVDPLLYLELIDELSYINSSAGWCAFINSTSTALIGAFTPDAGVERIFAGGRMPDRVGSVDTPRAGDADGRGLEGERAVAVCQRIGALVLAACRVPHRSGR